MTAITRPRRFGKTLTLRMVESFFSIAYAGRGDLFEGLSIWQEEHFRVLQGTYPVLFLNFAGVKLETFEGARKSICELIQALYNKYDFLLDGDILNKNEKSLFKKIKRNMPDDVFISSLFNLMEYLFRCYGKKVIVLLDEYDTPLQEAYIHKYWRKMNTFLLPFFTATFKNNPYLERGLMMGITRVPEDSIFSGFNNLDVVTTMSSEYEDCFGFTQEEVSAALKEYGLCDQAEDVRKWYDGYTFGNRTNIYNPWSIISFLSKRVLKPYWTNTSSNSLISSLIRKSSNEEKMDLEKLMNEEAVEKPVDEEIFFTRLGRKKDALWSFLLASGYLKAAGLAGCNTTLNRKPVYQLMLANKEVSLLFDDLISDWFSLPEADGMDFFEALIKDDLAKMNGILNEMARERFRFFDTGGNADSEPDKRPERFYHAFVLGLIACSRRVYHITSNRESGKGRYDVVLEPKPGVHEDPILIEFKVMDKGKEKNLEETAERALKRIDEKKYDWELLDRGFAPEKIRKYGFAFEGETVLIQRQTIRKTG